MTNRANEEDENKTWRNQLGTCIRDNHVGGETDRGPKWKAHVAGSK